MKACQIIISALVALAGIQIGSAAPAMFNYQGRLMVDEQPANGASAMTFTLYDAATGGNARYADTQTVNVVNGLYSVMIGASNSVGLATALTNSALYLEVKVGSDILTPRNRLGSVPYAMSAASYTIAAGAVTATELADGAVTTAKIAAGAVTAAEIADGTITVAELADNAVEAAKIKADAVTTAKILDSNVTSNKIANLAVESGKIQDLAVTDAKLAANSVITIKLADDAVTAPKIADGTIIAGNITDGAITSDKIAANGVFAVNITDGAITSEKIASNWTWTGIVTNKSTLITNLMYIYHGICTNVVVTE